MGPNPVGVVRRHCGQREPKMVSNERAGTPRPGVSSLTRSGGAEYEDGAHTETTATPGRGLGGGLSHSKSFYSMATYVCYRYCQSLEATPTHPPMVV
jgi:hypothetical protein